MVGFTFAMSLSRFEARRDAISAEADAIGTTALRARLLPEPHRKEVLELLRDYVKVRLDPTGLFIQTLNEMIDDQAKRLAAIRNRVPNVVQLGLFGVAIVASGFAGYATGLDKRRSRFPVYLMGLLAGAVILLILDLDRPGAGFIEVSQQPIIDTASSIAGYPD
jgi:hypothetical protein